MADARMFLTQSRMPKSLAIRVVRIACAKIGRFPKAWGRPCLQHMYWLKKWRTLWFDQPINSVGWSKRRRERWRKRGRHCI